MQFRMTWKAPILSPPHSAGGSPCPRSLSPQVPARAAATGGVAPLLRLEGLVVLAAAVSAYAWLGGSWPLFALLLLAPGPGDDRLSLRPGRRRGGL